MNTFSITNQYPLISTTGSICLLVVLEMIQAVTPNPLSGLPPYLDLGCVNDIIPIFDLNLTFTLISFLSVAVVLACL